jgi:ABC-type lipoprotein export system ATPase subunit
MKISLKSDIQNDRYTEYLYETYDIQDNKVSITSISADIEEILDKIWHIGVIIGNSGSGKSTILRQLGNIPDAEFHPTKALISNFDHLEPNEVAHLLTSMGLSSVPSWLRPYSQLSNGEQYRASLAYKVSKARDGDMILIDEYTSVVDRTVAKAMSYSLQKYIRRTGKKIILASCHFDILEWLMPDWICNLQKGGALEECDYLRQGRPKIHLQVFRCSFEAWDYFKKHHYLSDKVNKAARYFVFEWNEVPVCLVSVVNQPSGYVRRSVRGSRTVVLPDFQGLGIGSAVSNYIASIHRNIGLRYFTKTVNPALGEYRNNSPLWKGTQKNGKKTKFNHTNRIHMTSKQRPSYCHEYIGKPIQGHDELLWTAKDLLDTFKLSLFDD